MGTLLWNLVLCMFVASMPTLLLCYTAAFVRQYESFANAMPLVLLNVLFALSIISIVHDMRVSTLTVWAIVGYMTAGVVLALIVSGVLAIRAWKQLQIRTRHLLMKFREEEPTLSQSFLPY
ncbi:MAG: hypothetical protein JWM07_303 [Candidatus Saccharibacteria bacterium]|jgi:hypothetical protein|nr:hypothetical protein [Candidatus Saccharibacteria bacterium]